MAALFPEASVSLPWVVRRVHPDDRGSLRRLLRSDAPQSHWTSLRFHIEHGGWHHLAKGMLAALGAERRRADEVAEFSSALIATATEQELQQVVLTRLAATLGGTSAALLLVDNDHLLVSSDAGLPTWHLDALHCV